MGDPEELDYLDPEGRFSGLILLEPQLVPEEAKTVSAPDGRDVFCFVLVPLLLDEIQFNLEQQIADTLVERLYDAEVTDLVRPDRPSVCPS